ncbi:helix-turn-helix domain-containing protein [Bacillus altitudinis]|uniref:helix-turn-helix domain-containing protein n=1 Tax=Bacillus altitudinis TaxID=293387 RepID=UPI00203F4A70|nr:helix-turn-helix transcriptional regulator [Bacillus altitudinis]MCM3046692.1 helix-turn-helix transcriptional regulator [Bacillus altitudinis]MEC1805130.1 helix-turn-helix transcriptional regulator [Bacillus altitudinis]
MANSPYNVANLSKWMHMKRKEIGLSQYSMGQLLGGRDQKYVSNIENGIATLTPEICIRWFEVCGAYEHIDLVHFIFKLHPMAAAPINPALNDCAHKALINLVQEMKDAQKAINDLAEWLNNTRPGKHGELPMQAIKQIYDLTQANKTLMYSMAREFGLKITDLTEKWSKKAIVAEVAMHKRQDREAVLA